MHFSRRTAVALAAAFFPLLAHAQNSTEDVPTTTPDGSIMTHVIQVGDANGTFKFYPEELTNVNPGEMVQFHFWPQSHSVAQSAFDNPCQPNDGFWSGMMPVSAEDTTMPVFTIVVNNTDPIWFYCATGRHCQNGMTGVINPPDGRTLAQYKEAATEVENTGIPEGATGGSNSSVGSPTASGSPEASADASAGVGLQMPASALGALVALAAGALALL